MTDVAKGLSLYARATISRFPAEFQEKIDKLVILICWNATLRRLIGEVLDDKFTGKKVITINVRLKSEPIPAVIMGALAVQFVEVVTGKNRASAKKISAEQYGFSEEVNDLTEFEANTTILSCLDLVKIPGGYKFRAKADV